MAADDVEVVERQEWNPAVVTDRRKRFLSLRYAETATLRLGTMGICISPSRQGRPNLPGSGRPIGFQTDPLPSAGL